MNLKEVYHTDYDYDTYYDYYTIPIGIAQLNAFSCAKKWEEYCHRVRMILKSELNAANRIKAINTLAIHVATYSFKS